MRQKTRQQMLIVAAMGGLIVFMLGVTLGLVVSQIRGGSTVSGRNSVGMGVSRQGMMDHMAAAQNGAFTFELARGTAFDYYVGKSAESEGVTVFLNGPPDELQQVGLGFSLTNIGKRTEFLKVLRAVTAGLPEGMNQRRFTTWFDSASPSIEGADLQATTVIGAYRFILQPAPVADDKSRKLLMIEPAVIVRWSLS